MSEVTLPPRPDPRTGLPRPPAAPLDNSWGLSHRHPTDRTTPAPTPPLGQSPTLEWITRTWKGAYQVAAMYFVILVGFMTLKDWGIGWLTNWWLWLTIVILSGLGTLLSGPTEGMEAGADWFRYGRAWIRIYELIEIRLERAWGTDSLDLKDADDHQLSIKIYGIQTNPDLWNLVYNGILHSVHHGGAVANERAVARLRLDEPRSASAEDDQRG